MSARVKTWTCRRQFSGVPCLYVNQPRTRKCGLCGRPKPVRRRAKHMVALDLSYEQYMALNGGEHCGICGKPPAGRRLDRDHDHRTGKPRGLLCWSCNRQLRTWATVEWLRNAAAYLERAAA